MQKTDRNLLKGFKRYYSNLLDGVADSVKERKLSIIQSNLESALANTNLSEHGAKAIKLRIQAIKELRTELLINAAT